MGFQRCSRKGVHKWDHSGCYHVLHHEEYSPQGVLYPIPSVPLPWDIGSNKGIWRCPKRAQKGSGTLPHTVFGAWSVQAVQTTP